MIITVFITEKLQREIEVEAEDQFEALEKAEQEYNDGNIILDYSDLKDTAFTNADISKIDIEIIGEIGNFCSNCPSLEKCPEDDCVLYRIEKIIERNIS